MAKNQLMRMEVEGVAATLRTLSKADPELRKASIKNIKAAAGPLVNEARSLIPNQRPLSGWTHWKGGYEAAKIRSKITVNFRSGARKGRNEIPLLRMIMKGAPGAIFDVAGSASRGKTRAGRQFVNVLNSREGRASRAMWPAAERRLVDVQQAVSNAVDEMTRQMNQELNS